MVSTDQSPDILIPEHFRLITKSREFFKTYLNASKYDYFIPWFEHSDIPLPDPLSSERSKKGIFCGLLQQEKWKNVSFLEIFLDTFGQFPSNESNQIDSFLEKIKEDDEFDYHCGYLNNDYPDENYQEKVKEIVLDILIVKAFYYGNQNITAGKYLAYFMMHDNIESLNPNLVKISFQSQRLESPLFWDLESYQDKIPLRYTLIELTSALSDNKITNVSILDLPSFGAMIKDFDTINTLSEYIFDPSVPV